MSVATKPKRKCSGYSYRIHTNHAQGVRLVPLVTRGQTANTVVCPKVAIPIIQLVAGKSLQYLVRDRRVNEEGEVKCRGLMLVEHRTHCRNGCAVSLLRDQVAPSKCHDNKGRRDRGKKKVVIEVGGHGARVRQNKVQVKVDRRQLRDECRVNLRVHVSCNGIELTRSKQQQGGNETTCKKTDVRLASEINAWAPPPQSRSS